MRLFVSTKLSMSPIVLRLSRRLKISEPAAVGHITFFLWWVIENAPDGDLSDADKNEFATAAGWVADANYFFQAFVDAGLIMKQPNGTLMTYDWNEWKSGLYKVHGSRLAVGEWRALRAQVFERDHYVCVYCGRHTDKPHCDHVIPISRGGTNDIENLATACSSCNLSKHSKTVNEWLS